ncbi:MAG: hypothetical protein ACOCRX_08280 [Candidatus Woesearchaeota archaeon]
MINYIKSIIDNKERETVNCFNCGKEVTKISEELDDGRIKSKYNCSNCDKAMVSYVKK